MDSVESESPPSVINLFGLYSSNKSYIFAPMGRFFWNEDKNRAFVSTGVIRVNNDFEYEQEGIPIPLVFSELRNLYTLEYSRKIIGDFYLGILYLGVNTRYRFDQGSEEENDFTREFFKNAGIEDNFVSSLGINFSFDNRDYPYYPRRGFTFSIRPKLNAGWLGSENNYVDTDFSFKYYHNVTSDQILAFSVAGGLATGDVPFDGYQTYGFILKTKWFENFFRPQSILL